MRLVIINVVFFGLLGLLLLLVLGLYAGRHAGQEVVDHSVLVLQPRGQLVEQYSVEPLQRALAGLSGEAPKQVQLRDLVGAIDAAAKDSRITRIVLDASQLHSGGFAALREVGAALDRFRASGKPVIAWSPSLDQYQYYLAAHADRVLLDPKGELMITGLANYRLFYKDLLDKLGVQVHLFRVGQFKSAAEPYILDHASPASKEADSFWMGGLWDEYIDEVAKLRKIDPAALRADIDDLPAKIATTNGDLAQLALDEHLIDGTATRAQLIEMLRKQGVPAGKKGFGIREVGLARYVADLPHQGNAFAAGVTVVVAERRYRCRSTATGIDRRRIHRGLDPRCARGQAHPCAGAARGLARWRGVCRRADPPRSGTDPRRRHSGGGVDGRRGGQRRLLDLDERQPHHGRAEHHHRLDWHLRHVLLGARYAGQARHRQRRRRHRPDGRRVRHHPAARSQGRRGDPGDHQQGLPRFRRRRGQGARQEFRCHRRDRPGPRVDGSTGVATRSGRSARWSR
ncbi:signal peptide peptidase SppA, 67K type [Rhodanobacter sp. 115]|nr:signal peptide peptidase SppA, 67K type [Rhodanobacter sp. 115]